MLHTIGILVLIGSADAQHTMKYDLTLGHGEGSTEFDSLAEVKAFLLDMDVTKVQEINICDYKTTSCYVMWVIRNGEQVAQAEAVGGNYAGNLAAFKVILEAIEGRWPLVAVEECKEMIALHEELVAEVNGQLPPPPAEIKI